MDQRHEENVKRLTEIEVMLGRMDEKLDAIQTSRNQFMNEFREHTIQDRWTFAIIIGLLLAMAGKIFLY